MSQVTQINPREAFALLKEEANSALIDVRTSEEFNFVGIPESSSFGNRMILLPWQTLPAMDPNPDFAVVLAESLNKIFGDNSNQVKLLFICRTGGRSNQAAHHAINLGYKSCYNVTSGFEGDLNQQSQRGKVNGWKAESLPWRQF